MSSPVGIRLLLVPAEFVSGRIGTEIVGVTYRVALRWVVLRFLPN